MSKDLSVDMMAINDDALESVVGGTESMSTLLFNEKDKKTAGNAVMKGKSPVASSLVHKSKSTVEATDLMSGDPLSKGTYC